MASTKVADLQSMRIAGIQSFPFSPLPNMSFGTWVTYLFVLTGQPAIHPTVTISLFSSHSTAYFYILLCLSFRLLFQGQLIRGIAKVSQMRTFFVFFSSFLLFCASHFLRIPHFFLFYPWEDMKEECYTQNELFIKILPTHTDWFFLADFCFSCFLLYTQTAYYDFPHIKNVKNFFWKLLLWWIYFKFKLYLTCNIIFTYFFSMNIE